MEMPCLYEDGTRIETKIWRAKIEMPCLYKDGPRIETKICPPVGDLNIDGDQNLQENL